MADEVKLAILEQKFAEFTNIVNRIDDAINKLSEVSINVSKMLAVHDERIEQTMKANDILVRVVETNKKETDDRVKEIKTESKNEHKKNNDRIDELEMKIDEIKKIKWITIGVGILGSIVIGAFATVLSGLLTSGHFMSNMVEPPAKTLNNGSN